MTLYKRRPGQPLKWLIALIVFGLALGITFTDVYGYTGDCAGGSNGSDNSMSTAVSPSAVPEPATLILLAGGLGALYAARHRKKK